MSALDFADPWLFVATLPLLLVAEFARRRRQTKGEAFADFGWLGGLPVTRLDRLAAAWPALRALLLVLFALALANPRLARRALTDERPGVDLLVALDASSSMTATLAGSFASRRFDAAREAARTFAGRRPGDRLGLITFARYPRLRCPLTWDHALFEAMLAQTAPVAAAGEEDRTGIGVALADGAARLAAGSGRTRVLILVTDGANNVGPIEPLEGADFCRAEQVRVYPIALGAGEEFGSGRPAVDTQLLESIASTTGGTAFVARDASALQSAWATIDALEQRPTQRREGVIEQPLGNGLWVAVLIGWCLLVTVERRWLRSLP